MTDPTGGKEITDCQQLREAIARTDPSNESHKRFLTKKAIDLGCVKDIPDEWTMEVSRDN